MADHVRRALEASAEDKSRLYYWLIVLGKLGVCQHFDDNASHPKGAVSQDFFYFYLPETNPPSHPD